MTRLCLLFFVITGALARAEAPYSGFVTPTSMTIGFSDIRVRRTDGKLLTLLSGKFTHEFRRVDSDLVLSPLESSANVPQGRYIGVQICYDTNRRVKLDGVKYEGKSVSGFSDGDLLYSVGTEALASNSVSKTNPGASGATTMTGYLYSNTGSYCYDSFSPVPVCVGEASRCKEGDSILDPAKKTPTISLVFDLYHSVAVNAETKNVSNGIYLFPYAMIGSAGVGMHLGATASSGTRANVTLIFDQNKRLVHANSYGEMTDKGFCSGIGLVSVNATPVPAGSYLNIAGPTSVTRVDTTAPGKIQFAAADCAAGTTCGSKGVMELSGYLKAQGQTVSVDCRRDDLVDPPYLGFAYKTGAGGTGGTSSFTIQRIVDPQGLLGQCTGTCGAYP